MEKVWAHALVVCSPMVLGVEVTKVVIAWCPINQEMPLHVAALDPIEVHVNCAALALAHCGVDDSTCY
eukprot:1933372-Ditylum_brightwellii.AAC.1